MEGEGDTGAVVVDTYAILAMAYGELGENVRKVMMGPVSVFMFTCFVYLL